MGWGQFGGTSPEPGGRQDDAGKAMALNGSRKTRKPPRGGIVAALDLGSTKICCLIARADEAGAIKVIGIGHHVSHGVRAGAIVDMDSASAAIGNAVHSAEQMAGETIRDLVVNVSGGQPTSQTVTVEVAVLDHEVGDADLRRALSQSRTQHRIGDELIHAIPVGYALDGSHGIRDPRGMFGGRLGVDLHLITADPIPIRNLTTCLGRCILEIEHLVVASYAAGLACLTEDEVNLGVTCIDLGGGTTTISVFFDGNVVFTDCLPVGGSHVTNDIARGLNTSIAYAERMKILFGNALASAADERELIDVPQIGEEERGLTNHVPRSLLVGIIQPRLEEILELVRSRLEQSGFARQAGRRVVLTGGGSQLPGMRELAQLILDKQVRLGKPVGIPGLTDAAGGPAFSTAAGLLLHATRQTNEIPISGPMAGPTGGLWERVSLWLREYL